MQLKEGSELQNSKYRIIRVLGQGGFGITYLAENTFLEKMVAIKEFFPKDFCGRDNTSHLTLGTQNNAETVEKLKARFLKEAKNIAKLDHPGIIKIHDIFEENNTAYYVMDYIEGENLNEMVKRDGPLSETKAVEYIHKVGDALDYIHSRNMTHFDVKPANIMVRRTDDQPILIDFGLSKQYNAHGDATSTLMQGVSHGYSPIELYNPGSLSSFSPQTDVYSLGATLYFLLTGKVPPSASEVLENGITIPSSISDSNISAIQRAMSVNRSKRPQNIMTFVEQLSINSQQHNSYQEPKSEIEEDTFFINSESEHSESEAYSDSEQEYIKNIDKKSKKNAIILLIIIAIIGCFIISFIFLANEDKPAKQFSGNINGHDWVDLGLPSGLKWATCNIGANKPEEYGYYIEWGELIEKESYTFNNALIKENYQDIKGNPKLDVVTYQWKGSWRMPTSEDYKELIDNCEWNWEQINGINGYKIIGTNGNSIFLPAAGLKAVTWTEHVGKIGFYLCSDLDFENQMNLVPDGGDEEYKINANWCLIFEKTNKTIDPALRWARAKSVRAVSY